MRTNRTITNCIAAVTMSVAIVTAAAEESRWWPVQKMPKAIVRMEDPNGFFSNRSPSEMTAQSVAGLAAKAVSEGRADEMVWVATDNVDVEDWLARLQTDGLVTSYSEPSTDGPPRKYFQLTESGQKALEEMNKQWDQLIASLESIRKGSRV